MFPETNNIVYDISDLSQSTIDIRWNFTSRIYTYSKLYPWKSLVMLIYMIFHQIAVLVLIISLIILKLEFISYQHNY